MARNGHHNHNHRLLIIYDSSFMTQIMKFRKILKMQMNKILVRTGLNPN